MKKTTKLWIAFVSSTLMLLYSVLRLIQSIWLSSLMYLFERDQFNFNLSVMLVVIFSISSITLGYIIYSRNELEKSTVEKNRNIENSASSELSAGENNSGT